MMSASRPGLQPPPVVDVDQLGGHGGGGPDGLQRGHAPVDQGDELLGVAAVGDGRGVGAAGDLRAPLRWPC